ncbi:AsmA family protein [Gammaproteobacteria bacterium]
MRAVLKGLLLVLVIFLVSLALVPATFRWNWLRPPLSHWISTQLGRELTIQENIELELSWLPRIRIQGLRLANPPWSQRALLVEVEELMVQIDLSALLQGRWVLPEVALTRPVFHLERSPQGIANWTFAKKEGGSEGGGPSHFTIGRLLLREGRLTFIDPILDVDFIAHALDLDSQSLVLRGNGQIRGRHAEIKLHTDPLLALLQPERAFGIEGCFTWGNTHGRWSGTLTAPWMFQGADLEVEMAGESLAALSPIFGIPLPNLPPYHIQGHLSQQETKWVAQHLQGVVGGSDFAGNITWEGMGKRPRLTGHLISNHLALMDIGIGRSVTRETPPDGAVDTVEPASAIGMDVDLEVQGRRIVTPIVLEEVKTHLRLEDGQLHMTPLNFGLAGGQVQSVVGMDTHYNPMPITLETHFQQIDLQRFLTSLGGSQQNSGVLTGRLRFSSGGGSVGNLLATAEGSAFFVVTRGHLDSLFLALVRLDLAKTLTSLLFLDNRVELRCAVAQVLAHNGVFTIQPLVIDTTSTKVTGSGTMDLRQEQLDLTLEPHPKDLSLFSAHSPLRVTGSFQSPEVRPKAGPLGGRMAAAAALGALIGPVGAVMPFIEPGIGEDNDCQNLVHSTTTLPKEIKQ